MNIYPAIDLFEGKVVRLTQGDFSRCTVYSEDPADTARSWERQGAQWIHVVDLEGAKTGLLKNEKSLFAIRKSVKCSIQFGGGVRDLDTIKKILDLGINRVVLGTKALDRSLLQKAVQKFGDAIAVGLDVRKDRVQTSGWLQSENVTTLQALEFFNALAIRTLIYTDIEKDGALEGPNWEKLTFVLDRSQSRIILSGGISQLTDIQKCRTIKQKNFEGTIIGKALYDQKIVLAEAIKIFKTEGTG